MSPILASTTAECLAALKAGARLVQMAPGSYGKLVLDAGCAFPEQVTITSADPEDPAVFTELRADGARNVRITGVEWRYPGASWAAHVPCVRLRNCEDVALTGNLVRGIDAQGLSASLDGYPTGVGIETSGGQRIRIEGNEVRGFAQGMKCNGVGDIAILGNEIWDFSCDGLINSALRDVLIEGNDIHSPRRAPNSGAHVDMIQFTTTGSTTTPSVRIAIRRNRLDVGLGDACQTIFMGNEAVHAQGQPWEVMAYRDVLIEDNEIANGHSHGISPSYVNGLAIRGNTVLHADGRRQDGADADVEIPTIRTGGRCENVLIENNVAAAWPTDQGFTVRGNLRAQDQDPDAPDHYGRLFVDGSWLPQDGRHRPRALPGGIIAQAGAGAAATRAPVPQPAPAPAPAAELDALRAEVERLGGEIATNEAERARLAAELDAALVQIQDLVVSVVAGDQARAAVEAELAAAQARIARAQEALATA